MLGIFMIIFSSYVFFTVGSIVVLKMTTALELRCRELEQKLLEEKSEKVYSYKIRAEDLMIIERKILYPGFNIFIFFLLTIYFIITITELMSNNKMLRTSFKKENEYDMFSDTKVIEKKTSHDYKRGLFAMSLIDIDKKIEKIRMEYGEFLDSEDKSLLKDTIPRDVKNLEIVEFLNDEIEKNALNAVEKINDSLNKLEEKLIYKKEHKMNLIIEKVKTKY